MKVAVCAVLLLLALLHQAEAQPGFEFGNAPGFGPPLTGDDPLTCNYCRSMSGGLCTDTTPKVCPPFSACVAVLFPGPMGGSVRNCMNRLVCRTYGPIGGCCFTNLCN